ncbi:MAG TPA: ATP-binding protein [Rhodocyclaceae bacterium]|nr:ATP-binding protein [Rhodocyclaceae bacterium]
MSARDLDIGTRALVIAVLPAFVVAVVLIAYFTHSRLNDLEDAHSQRGKALARQLAAASSYVVFTGNKDALGKLAAEILDEPDVVRVAVRGPGKDTLTDLRKPAPSDSGALRLGNADSDTLAFQEAIHSPGQLFDDPFVGAEGAGSELHAQQGEVIVELSRDALHGEETRLLRNAVLMVFAVLLGSVVLALRLSRGITRPIQRIASTVARIGQGERAARVRVEGGHTLRALGQGVNDMADRIAAASENLERQIEAATAELLEKKNEAELANQAKTRFLAAASHDLRQPMHALGLFVAELGQKPHAPDTCTLVEQIAMSAETMEDLLDSLLDISRLDAGALEPQIKPFPLQPLLERVDVDYRREAERRGQRLRLRPTDLWVSSDPLLLERILHNLISNALRYAPGGTVLVACRRRGAQVTVEVRDNGPGIAPDAQEAIFHEFVQLDNPERNRAKGLGLGLAIVRRLTTLLGHPLGLRSRPGRGALFSVPLPVTAPRPQDLSPPSSAARGLAGLHVALIDDDPLAAASTLSLLESWGCLVTAADTLEHMYAALQRSEMSPDIMLCDHHLDGALDGVAVVARLRQLLGTDLTAIILSSDTTLADSPRVRDNGIRVLRKPVRPARLRALLQRKTGS